MTMTNMMYFESFNTKLDEFLRDLMSTFPEMKDIKVLRSGVQLAKTMDIKMPQSFFNSHVAMRYEDKILEKDERFFLEEDYRELLSQKINGQSIDMDIVGKLKQIWGTLDDDNKSVVWKYLHVLVLLNRKCNMTQV